MAPSFGGRFFHVNRIGTRRTKCSSKLDTTSINNPTVEVANCERDIDIVTMNMKRMRRMHSTSEARGYSTIGGIMLGILGSVRYE